MRYSARNPRKNIGLLVLVIQVGDGFAKQKNSLYCLTLSLNWYLWHFAKWVPTHFVWSCLDHITCDLNCSVMQRIYYWVRGENLLFPLGVPAHGLMQWRPPMVSEKGKIRRLWVFLCVGVTKIDFSFILNKEIHALRGLLLRFKHYKGVSFRGWVCPLDPQDIFAPSNSLPWRRPWANGCFILARLRWHNQPMWSMWLLASIVQHHLFYVIYTPTLLPKH